MDKFNELNDRLINNNMNGIYRMEELNDVLSSRNKEPRQIILMTRGEDFNLEDSFFEFDGYGNLISHYDLQSAIDKYDDIY